MNASARRHAAVALALLFFGACGNSGPKEKPKGPVVVRTQPIHLESVPATVDISGTLGGAEEITVSTEVDGRVEHVDVDLGDAVEAKGALVHLASAELSLQVDQAAADFLQALAKLGTTDEALKDLDLSNVAGVKRATADFNDAKLNLERTTQLFEQKLVAQGELDTALTRARVAEAAMQAATDDARSALATAQSKKAALGLARKRLRDATPTSPVAGVVSERLVSLGEFVRAGQAIARVVVVDPLKLKGDVPERYASSIRAGMPVQIELDALHKSVEGRISRVAPSVAEASRTFRVEALVDNKDRALKPGTFARAKVVIGTNESVAYVPETAVSNVAGVTKVFVVEDGRAKARDVEVLRKRGSDALISGPLKDGDALVLTAISRLFDGTEVKVDNAAPEATERKPDAAGEGKPRAKPTGKEASNAGAAQ